MNERVIAILRNRLIHGTNRMVIREADIPNIAEDIVKLLAIPDVSPCYPKEFVEWVGYHFIRMQDYWVHRYSSQINRTNWQTTEELYKKWLEHNKG